MIHISHENPIINAVKTLAIGDIWIVDLSNIKSTTQILHKYNHTSVLVYQSNLAGGYNWGIFYNGVHFNVPKSAYFNGAINMHPIEYDSRVHTLGMALKGNNVIYNTTDVVIARNIANGQISVHEYNGGSMDQMYPLVSTTTSYTPWFFPSGAVGVVGSPGPIGSQGSQPTPITTGSTGSASVGSGATTLTKSTNQKLLNPNSLITIYDAFGNVMVDIDTMGNIVYGQQYTPDAAAQHFWAAIAKNSPIVLQNQISQLQHQLIGLQATTSPGTSKISTKTQDTDDSSDSAYQRAMKILG